jgi:hypothetical protein
MKGCSQPPRQPESFEFTSDNLKMGEGDRSNIPKAAGLGGDPASVARPGAERRLGSEPAIRA